MKLYSTQNLSKAISFGTAMAIFLSSTSPIFSANLAITGANVQNSSGTNVVYPKGSHGSIVFAGDDDYCGVDHVIGRGGLSNTAAKITAKVQYDRFINDQAFNDRHPYGTMTQKAEWIADGATSQDSGYMGVQTTGGATNVLPEAYGIYSFVTGCGAYASGNYSTAFGAGATTKAGGAQALGVSALASGIVSIAMGVGSEASGKSAVAIGGLTEATKDYTIAIGSNALAQAAGAIAIGSSKPVEESGQTRQVIAKAENAIAIGFHTYAEKHHSVAIGANAQVLVNDGVAVGGGSISRIDRHIFGYDPITGGVTKNENIAWKSTSGAFSVGDTTLRVTRQITGVAAGKEDTDAVNVAQLKAMRDVIAGDAATSEWQLKINGTDAMTIGPNGIVNLASVDNGNHRNIEIVKNGNNDVTFDLAQLIQVDRVITGSSNMGSNGFIITGGPRMTTGGIHAGGKQLTGVAEGERDTDAVNVAQLNAMRDVIVGNAATSEWQLKINGTDAMTIGPNGIVNLTSANKDNHSNIEIVKDSDNDVTFDLAQLIKVDRVITGSSNMGSNGFIITGGPSMTTGGIHAGGKQLTGVAEGKKDTDAVNVAQLKAMRDVIAEDVATSEWQLKINGADAMTIGPDGIVNLTSANKDNHSNIEIVKDSDNDVTFDLARLIKVDRVITGSSNMSSNGFIITNGPSMTTGGIHAGGKQLTGVAEGKRDTDAVNVAQLNAMRDVIAEDAATSEWQLRINGTDAMTIGPNGIVNLASVDNYNHSNIEIVKNGNNDVTFDLAQLIQVDRVITGSSNMGSNGFIITGGPRMTTGGIHAGGKQLTGVAEGERDTDAVNVAQLNAFKNTITNNVLVKQEGGESSDITIGKETGGTTIKIANKSGEARTISGVKAATEDDEAVNKKQLDGHITNINNSIEVIKEGSTFAVLYDKKPDGRVNYESITLGGSKAQVPVALHNVKDGRIALNSTDAITGNQLYRMGDQIAKYFGGGANYNGGQWTNPNFQIVQINPNGTSGDKRDYSNVAEAFGGVNNSILNVNNRIAEIKDKVDADVLRWNNNKGAYDASHNGRMSKITNVANGKIQQDSTDAVNGGQLWETNERVTNVEKQVNNIEKRVDNISNTIADVGAQITNIENKVDNIENQYINLVDGVVSYDKDVNGRKTNKITLKGGDESEPVLIDNVANGSIASGSKEAVNGGQLHDYTAQQMQIILDNSKHYTDQRVKNIVVDAIDDAVDQSKRYTDMKFNTLNYSIENVQKEAKQAAAIGLAVSNLRYNDTPGKLSIALGSGIWRSQSALAFGAGYTSESGNVRSNLSITGSGGHWGIGAGFNLTLN
ncbi:Vomp family autotransporter [Bartonella sp. B35(2025)]